MEPIKEYYEKQAAALIRNLNKRGMDAWYCADSKEAVQKALSLIKEDSQVTWGGSQTIFQCGLIDALKAKHYNLLDRTTAKSPEETTALYRQAFFADHYLMSANAITLDGQLVNIDGTGNRCAALSYGPEHVLILVGMNKVAPDLNAALSRARNAAAPPNAMRLSMETPCALSGSCKDCTSPDCICSQILITRYNRTPGRIQVLLIGESLGY